MAINADTLGSGSTQYVLSFHSGGRWRFSAAALLRYLKA